MDVWMFNCETFSEVLEMVSNCTNCCVGHRPFAKLPQNFEKSQCLKVPLFIHNRKKMCSVDLLLVVWVIIFRGNDHIFR